jgi:hypothetical protein
MTQKWWSSLHDFISNLRNRMVLCWGVDEGSEGKWRWISHAWYGDILNFYFLVVFKFLGLQCAFRPVSSKLFWLAIHFWINKILAIHQIRSWGKFIKKSFKNWVSWPFSRVSLENLVIFRLFEKISRHQCVATHSLEYTALDHQIGD